MAVRRPRCDAALGRVVFRWDLDKTYLKSEFDSLRELVRIPFEKAADKVAAPGVAALIRALRECALGHGREVRVSFVSASPPQIGRAIREKLELDGILYDAIVFKDQLQRLMRGKFRHLREQVGFKLTELLRARGGEPAAAREYLFGDDWESDAMIYSLYADVIAGRVGEAALADILRALRVDEALIAEAGDLARGVARADAVARIFINLERRTPPGRLRGYGSRLVPTFNYFQTATCLYAEGVLNAAGLVQVARSLVEESGYSAEQLLNSLADVERRGHLDADAGAAVREILGAAGLATAPRPGRAERWRRWWQRQFAGDGGARRPLASDVPVIDYRAVAGAPPAADSGSG